MVTSVCSMVKSKFQGMSASFTIKSHHNVLPISAFLASQAQHKALPWSPTTARSDYPALPGQFWVDCERNHGTCWVIQTKTWKYNERHGICCTYPSMIGFTKVWVPIWRDESGSWQCLTLSELQQGSWLFQNCNILIVTASKPLCGPNNPNPNQQSSPMCAG